MPEPPVPVPPAPALLRRRRLARRRAAAAAAALESPVLQPRAPGIEALEGALVTPGRLRPVRRYSGEVWRADGSLAPLSLRPSARSGWPHVPPPAAPAPAAPARLAGRHLFVGPLFRIFGHDLVELPGRLWPLLEPGAADGFDGIVATKWDPAADPVALRLDATILGVLAAFGIGFERIHLIERPTLVERLVVPEQAFHVSHYGLPVLGAVFRRIAAHYRGAAPALPGRGLYLSRTGVGSRIGNEPEVEAAARAAGLQVLAPERSALPVQIALMDRAAAIAGSDGSGLHLAAFARPGTRLLCLDTRDLRNQAILNAAAGLDARTIPLAPGAPLPDPAAVFRDWLA